MSLKEDSILDNKDQVTTTFSLYDTPNNNNNNKIVDDDDDVNAFTCSQELEDSINTSLISKLYDPPYTFKISLHVESKSLENELTPPPNTTSSDVTHFSFLNLDESLEHDAKNTHFSSLLQPQPQPRPRQDQQDENKHCYHCCSDLHTQIYQLSETVSTLSSTINSLEEKIKKLESNL